MFKSMYELYARAKAGDEEAKKDINEIKDCLKSMDDDRVANCIILMKEKIPGLGNQVAILIKKYVVNQDRSLENLSTEEVELIEFLRAHLKY